MRGKNTHPHTHTAHMTSFYGLHKTLWSIKNDALLIFAWTSSNKYFMYLEGLKMLRHIEFNLKTHISEKKTTKYRWINEQTEKKLFSPEEWNILWSLRWVTDTVGGKFVEQKFCAKT